MDCPASSAIDRTRPPHTTRVSRHGRCRAGLRVFRHLGFSFSHLVNFCIFLNWLGDSLDGTLARYRNKLRPRYGFYVDHIIDSFGAVFLLVGLALSGLMSERIALSLLALYLLLSIHSYLTAHTLGVFRISFFHFSPTELRLLLVVGNLVVLFKPFVSLWGHRWLLFDVGGVVGILILALVIVISTTRVTRALYDIERV